MLLSSLPSLTEIPGVDLKRQWYLYENISQHCNSRLAADLTCPKPSLPKPATASTSQSKPLLTKLWHHQLQSDHVNVASTTAPDVQNELAQCSELFCTM